MTVTEGATLIAKVGAAIAVLTSGASWAWQKHNGFLMQQLSPLLRASYVARINNLRRIDCMNQLTEQQQLALEDALADYEELTGRPISERGCDTLL